MNKKNNKKVIIGYMHLTDNIFIIIIIYYNNNNNYYYYYYCCCWLNMEIKEQNKVRSLVNVCVTKNKYIKWGSIKYIYLNTVY